MVTDFDRFVQAVAARLEQGREAYGDRSFSAEPSALLAELEQEALDLAGWGFVLWARLQRARAAANTLKGSTMSENEHEETENEDQPAPEPPHPFRVGDGRIGVDLIGSKGDD